MSNACMHALHAHCTTGGLLLHTCVYGHASLYYAICDLQVPSKGPRHQCTALGEVNTHNFHLSF